VTSSQKISPFLENGLFLDEAENGANLKTRVYFWKKVRRKEGVESARTQPTNENDKTNNRSVQNLENRMHNNYPRPLSHLSFMSLHADAALQCMPVHSFPFCPHH
jgi:hypothetical protein